MRRIYVDRLDDGRIVVRSFAVHICSFFLNPHHEIASCQVNEHSEWSSAPTTDFAI
jgi:hypothetical protein